MRHLRFINVDTGKGVSGEGNRKREGRSIAAIVEVFRFRNHFLL
jgi:hypothetical protein